MNTLHLLACCLLLLSSTFSNAQPDTIIINNTPLTYYKINTKQPNKKGLIIYMHGGVSQYKGRTQPVDLTPNELLEGNEEWLPAVDKNGYDIILPIAYNEYNWLEEGGTTYINQLLNTCADQYDHIYISGFSDGGTGAFQLFYNNPKQYDGVIVFNGFPQLGNYDETVNHLKAIGKNIIFCSTTSDKVIPYEFPMIQFRRQQIVNKHTYFILRKGTHAFGEYQAADFELCLNLLRKGDGSSTDNDMLWVYPPIDGLIIDGEVKELYPFRKKYGKMYSLPATEYARADYSYKQLSKQLSEGNIVTEPLEVSIKKIETNKTLDFTLKISNEPQSMKLNNWLYK